MENILVSDYEIGIDEAGRGPLIGRVYAGAVIWGPNTAVNDLVNDSKKLTPKKRATLVNWIKTNVLAWGIGWAEPNEIDSINILEATKLAMDRAIHDLKSKLSVDNITMFNQSKQLVIDGCGWEKKFIDYNVRSVVKGDSKVRSISAASILAKEYHDEHIRELCKSNPTLDQRYSLLSNMGYGTKSHIDGINKWGISEYHRKTFKPCCFSGVEK